MLNKLANLDEVLQKLRGFLPQYLAEHGIDTSKNFPCLNPKHEDDSPSMSCAKNPENAYCFGCGVTLDIFQAAHWLEDKPISGPTFIEENVKYLADKFGIELEIEEMTEEELYRYRTYRAYTDAASLITSRTYGNHEKLNAEIARRGWDQATASKVGTVEYKEFRNALRAMGYEPRFQDEIDLGRPDIFNENHMIFIVKDEWGRVVGFAARNLVYDGGAEPKYTNQKTTGLRCNIYQKGRRLYEIHTALKNTPPLYIFEGYSDVLTAQSHGLQNCCAIGGTAFTPQHIELLQQLNQRSIVLVLDGDTPGKTRTAELLDKFFCGQKELQVEIINLPDEMDPDDFLRAKGLEEFLNLRKWSAFEWRLNQYNEEASDEEVCKVMIPLIVNEASFIVQDKLCGVLAKFTGIDKKAIKAELERLQNLKEREKSREKEIIVDQAYRAIKDRPEEAKELLYECVTKIEQVDDKYDENSFSAESVLSWVEQQRLYEESLTGEYAGFYLSPIGLGGLGEHLNGNWRQDVLMCFGGSANSGKCLTGDARIMHAATGELRTIEEIVCERLPHPCLTLTQDGTICTASVSEYFNEGEKETLSIKTILGHKITGTLVHPVMTQRGWVQLQNLVLTDKIAIPKKLKRTINKDRSVSDEEVRLLGYLISEGCLTRGFGIASDTPEVISDFYYCVKTIFGSTVDIRIDNEDHLTRCNSYFVVRNNTKASERCIEIGSKIQKTRIAKCMTRRELATKLGISESKLRGLENGIQHTNCLSTALLIKQILDTSGKLLSREDLWFLAYENPAKGMLLEYGLFDKLAKDKEIPSQVFTWSDRQISLLLSAMWDCDGSYSNSEQKISVELSSASSKLVYDIQHLLLRLGILARTRYKPVILDAKIFDSWIVELTSNRYVSIFIELTSSLAKVTQRENISKRILSSLRSARGYYGVDEQNADYYLVPLKKIESAGLQRVYDISIYGTHNFIANDIIVHNTSLCCQLAYEIAADDRNNACVIYHTIDDSRDQILPRFICQAYGMTDLTMNQIRNPNYYLKYEENGEALVQRRKMGYEGVLGMIRQGRLIIKDANDGVSFAFGESLINYYQRKFPEKQIVYILDNLHKTPDYSNLEPRMRFKTLSNRMKETAVRHRIPIIATVEYTKLPPATIPNNNNIAETRAVIYDSNFIGHLYNDLHERGAVATSVHEENDTIYPRIRLGFGKNKITEFKDRIFLDFFPGSGIFRPVRTEVAEREQMKRSHELRRVRGSEFDRIEQVGPIDDNEGQEKE